MGKSGLSMFEKIIGNQAIKEMLAKAIENETLSHSYLFVGTQGIGKKLLAKEMAKKILSFDGESHPDFMCIEPEENSIKIAQIRILQKKIQEKPIIADKKVYIIDNADTMTVEAQNCLLKTLEEPPEFAIIILIGSQESAFLTTIKSRCMIVKFGPIQEDKIIQFMKNNYAIEGISQNQLEMFQGSIGKAILLKDKQEQYGKIEDMIENLNQKDLIEIVTLAEPLYKAKEEIFEILEYMNIVLLKLAKQNYLYTNCIEIVENTKKRLKQSANYDMSIDDLVFNIWEEVN
jgi:DNA polymerase-3 subunit delta'